MASRMYNNSVASFGTTLTRVVGISYKVGGNWVEVTRPEDANKIYEFVTQPDFAVSLKFRGGCSMTPGAKDTLTLTWTDGTSTTCPGTWQCGPIETTGDQDAPITGTAELRPTVPD